MADNYRRFSRNPQIFNKSGRMRPGVITRTMPQESPNEDPSKLDREKRTLVVNKIIELLVNEKNLTLEEACRKIAENEDITKEFNYIFGTERSEEQIKKIAGTYASWYNGRVRQKREIEKGF